MIDADNLPLDIILTYLVRPLRSLERSPEISVQLAAPHTRGRLRGKHPFLIEFMTAKYGATI